MAETKVKSGNNLLITGIVVVVVGAIAFFGGMQFQKMQKSGASQFAAQNGQGGRTGANGRFGGGQFRGGAGGGANRPVIGQILSSDANGITVKMMDGSTKIVLVGTNTKINKTTSGAKSDLKTGENVAVVGTANSDGTVTGTSIQLNPQTMFGARPSGTPAAAQK